MGQTSCVQIEMSQSSRVGLNMLRLGLTRSNIYEQIRQNDVVLNN